MSTTATANHSDIALHSTLRFATGVTAAFVLGELMQWTPTFVAAVFASALLGNLPGRPPLKVTVFLIVVMGLSGLFAYALTAMFRGMPTVLYGLVALVMFLAFNAAHSGKPALPALFLLICMATVPVLMMVAPAYGDVLPLALFRGLTVALIMVWLVFSIWPRVAPPSPPRPPPKAATPVVTALISTVVVMPVLLVYLMFGFYDVLPVLVGTIILVANFDPNVSRKLAFGQVLANFAGGLVGLLIYVFSQAMPSLFFLGTVVFLFTLGFGKRIAAGGPQAPLAAIACNACLIILGATISSGSATLSVWLVRVFQFALAGAFVIGMMSLLWHYVSTRHVAAEPIAGP